ncbi:MAG: alcohol dehydrogenase family protein [Pseudomonadota bacterium]|nr:alcohol dehydrogenase family protein [Pseudomonadota bacterium]
MSRLSSSAPASMWAVVTTGNGGYDRLEYRRVPTPVAKDGEVLVRVLAAGMNNTEINTRLGWYSGSVSASTDELSSLQEASAAHKADGGWNEATPFPIIQGTDCCGIVVALGGGGDTSLVGKRVLVRACMRPDGFGSMDNVWMASDFDGAFAQFVKVPQTEVFPINCDWTDAELATIPCAYATAETMLHRAGCRSGDHVLVVGASGGVGSAALQLAKRRGARVTALTSRGKAKTVTDIGADNVILRGEDIVGMMGEESVDLVVDNVAGEMFPLILKLLRRGGRYTSSGAIAGPVVSLDMRDMYLKDISLIGTTAWDETVFPDLIRYIEAGEIRPILARTFPLAKIVAAQKEFSRKEYVGNFVLIPPEI